MARIQREDLDIDALLAKTCAYAIEKILARDYGSKGIGKRTGNLREALSFDQIGSHRYRITFKPMYHYAKYHNRGSRAVPNKLMIIFKDPRQDPRIKADGTWAPADISNFLLLHRQCIKRGNPGASPIYIIRSRKRIAGAKFWDYETIKKDVTFYLRRRLGVALSEELKDKLSIVRDNLRR